jgi:hypothetical protein
VLDQSSFYLFASNLVAIAYAVYRIWTNKDRLVYHHIQGRVWFRLKSILYTSFITSIQYAAYATFGYLVGYELFGSSGFFQFTTLLKVFGFKLAKQSFSFLTPFGVRLQWHIFFQFVHVFTCWEFLHAAYNLLMTLVLPFHVARNF